MSCIWKQNTELSVPVYGFGRYSDSSSIPLGLCSAELNSDGLYSTWLHTAELEYHSAGTQIASNLLGCTRLSLKFSWLALRWSGMVFDITRLYCAVLGQAAFPSDGTNLTMRHNEQSTETWRHGIILILRALSLSMLLLRIFRQTQPKLYPLKTNLRPNRPLSFS